MQFSLEEAKELRRQLLAILKGHSSNVEIHPADGSSYRVLVRKRDRVLPELPVGVEVIEEDIADPVDNVNLDKTTPGKPSPFSKDLGKPLSDSNRSVEPPKEFRMRNREIQDLVQGQAVAEKLAQVSQGIRMIANSTEEVLQPLLEAMREKLIRYNYKQTSVLWRLLQKIHDTMDYNVATEFVAKLQDDKFSEETLDIGHQILSVLERKSERDKAVAWNEGRRQWDEKKQNYEVVKLKQIIAHLATLEKSCLLTADSIKRLKFPEEAARMLALASNIREIRSALVKTK